MAAAAPAVAPPAGSAGPAPGKFVQRRRRIGEMWFTPYVFIAPHLLIFLGFVGYPFIYGIWISLHDWQLFRPSEFVGLQNFIDLFDPGERHFRFFWHTLWNTVLFVIMSTPALVIIALALANLLNGKFRGRNLFRGIYFAPWTLSIAVVGLVWWWIFQTNGGLINNLLGLIGIDGPGWLTSQPWAWLTILIATVWWTIGFNTIILLAGMQGISVDLYEASAIDGANRWQQFWNITVPSLRPILLLVVTLQVIASFNLVGQPQIITAGGPPTAETTPVLLYIYDTGFRGRFEYGPAAAMALIVAVIMLIVSVVNFRFFSSERA